MFREYTETTSIYSEKFVKYTETKKTGSTLSTAVPCYNVVHLSQPRSFTIFTMFFYSAFCSGQAKTKEKSFELMMMIRQKNRGPLLLGV